jgi:hypothetical protein
VANKKDPYLYYASGNIMAVYEFGLGKDGNYAWVWTEQHLYGAERLGVHQVKEDWLAALNPVIEPQNPHFVGHNRAFRGRKHYELTNHTSTTLSDHLGNVMVVVNDTRSTQATAPGTLPYALAGLVSATDYDPFGIAMEERQYQQGGVAEYGFGFNTQLESPEIGDGHTTAMYWEYDARIGRRWELDPVFNSSWSGYCVMRDNPIFFIDKLGDTPSYKDGKCSAITAEVKDNLTYITLTETVQNTVKHTDGTSTITRSTMTITNTVDLYGNVSGSGAGCSFLKQFIAATFMIFLVRRRYEKRGPCEHVEYLRSLPLARYSTCSRRPSFCIHRSLRSFWVFLMQKVHFLMVLFEK